MVTPELVHALTAARRQTTQSDWHRLASKLAAMNAGPDPASIPKTTSNLSPDAASILAEAFRKQTTATWRDIAVAMTTVDCLAGDLGPLTEIIWTGPVNNRFPVRRIDQVLYDLIAKAKHRIVLVTFAAHRVRRLCDNLTAAVDRGVKLTLIVECKHDSKGQLSFDAIEAFRHVPATRTSLYYWPLAKRERNQAGRPGKLHMKCAIIDDVAVIGSANLTDDAFNRNMELGMLVRDRPTVTTLLQHFDELIHGGTLAQVPIP